MCFTTYRQYLANILYSWNKTNKCQTYLWRVKCCFLRKSCDVCAISCDVFSKSCDVYSISNKATFYTPYIFPFYTDTWHWYWLIWLKRAIRSLRGYYTATCSTRHVHLLWRGRSKFLNLCPIPIALCCNENMFKSNPSNYGTKRITIVTAHRGEHVNK